ncbi:MAG TPA: hypothetical protein VFW65_02310 [Pseudonocardiaceae bacterium]|nr:hypothetical protein [Pseudonocardiaceae bacterium]
MTRTVATLAAVACGVLVTLAACGSPAESAGSGSGPHIGIAAPSAVGGVPPSAVGSGNQSFRPAPPVMTVVPPGQAAPPAGKATTVPSGQIDASHVTSPPGGVKAAGREVMFNAGQAGCQQITGQVAAQTAKAVTVDVVTTNTSHGGQVCPMIVRLVPVTVTLAAPLGDRTLVFQQVMRHG